MTRVEEDGDARVDVLARARIDGSSEDLTEQPGESNSDTVEPVRCGVVRTLRLSRSDTEIDRIPGEAGGKTGKERSATVDSFDRFNNSRSNFIFFDRLDVAVDSRGLKELTNER